MPAYTPPRVITTRQSGQSSVVLSVGGILPCFIGRSNGKRTLKSAYAATMGASGTYTFPSLGLEGPISSIVQIRSKQSGGLVYLEGSAEDFTFDVALQQITWNNKALIAPYVTKIEETSGTSALVAATTYYYLVSAYRTTDYSPATVGETAASNEVSFTVSASSKRLKLTWQSVIGAEGYKVYRSTVQGNFTGSALLATLVGEFVNSYEDAGGSLVAGSPLGVSVYAQVVAANSPTYNLEPNQTLLISVDGGANQTATFLATRAARTGVAASYSVVITGGSNDTLTVNIDGAGSQTITIAAGTYTLAQLVTFINAYPLVGGFADDDGGQLRISSDKRGSGSSVQIVGGTSLATIGHSAGTTLGTGNVSNIDAVTAAEVASVINAIPFVGAVASVNGAGKPILTHSTAGVSFTLQVNSGTANSAIGFPTTLFTGATASAATAVRRPAYDASSANFYVDYAYIKYDHLKLKRFTSLGDVQAEFGLGSDLMIAATLAMGTSGQGNAAPAILAMSIASNTVGAFQAALTELEKSREPTLVVPCATLTGTDAGLLRTAVKAHCELMSGPSHRRRRIGIVGLPIGTLPGDKDTADTAAYIINALGTKRMIGVYPWHVASVQQSDGSFVETELDGWATAAMLAGRYAALPDRATPATQKEILGIVRAGIELDEFTMNVMGEASATVIYDDYGAFKVRDALTTTSANAEDQQPGIVLVEDQLAQQLETDFKQFLGAKLLPDVLRAIADRTGKTLRLFVSKQLIVSVDEKSITASQDALTLTTVNVTFTYRPINQLKEISFKYSFDLTPLSLTA
jgi:hypothetical protein